MSKIIKHGGGEIDIDDVDLIPNLIGLSAELESKSSPELSKMVIDLWSISHAMRNYILDNDEPESKKRLVKMAKHMQPLMAEIVPQVGSIKTTRPNDYANALAALTRIIDEAPLVVEK